MGSRRKRRKKPEGYRPKKTRIPKRYRLFDDSFRQTAPYKSPYSRVKKRSYHLHSDSDMVRKRPVQKIAEKQYLTGEKSMNRTDYQRLVCRQRRERQISLFASGKAGKGQKIRTRKQRTEKSKMRC